MSSKISYKDRVASIQSAEKKAFKAEAPMSGPVGGFISMGQASSSEIRKQVGLAKDKNFFGHSQVNKQNIVKNPPKQVPQLGKDRFYSNVKNRTGKL